MKHEIILTLTIFLSLCTSMDMFVAIKGSSFEWKNNEGKWIVFQFAFLSSFITYLYYY